MRAPASLDVLRHREFRLLFAGQTISLVGDGALIVALPFAVFSLGGSPATVGFVLAAGQGPLAALILAGGVVADRLPRRAVMLTADAVRMCGMAVGAALLVSGRAQIWELVVIQVAYGVAAGFFYPAFTGLLPTVVPPELLQPANALRGIALAAGQMVGPAIAGVVVATAGPGWAYAADAATFGVSALSLALLHVPPHVARGEPQHFFRDLHDGWRAFTALTWVWAAVVLVGGLGSVLYGARQVLGPAVARAHLGGAGAWAAIVASGAVGAIVGGVALLHVRPRRPLLVMALAWLPLTVPPLLLAIPAPTALIAAAAFVAGIGLATGNSLWETSLARAIPPESLSRVSAYDWFGSLALGPLSLLVVGPLAVAVGTRAVLIAASAIFLCGNLAFLTLRAVRG